MQCFWTSVVCRPIHLLEKFPHKFTFFICLNIRGCLLPIFHGQEFDHCWLGIPVRSTTGFEGDCKSVVDGFLIQPRQTDELSSQFTPLYRLTNLSTRMLSGVTTSNLSRFWLQLNCLCSLHSASSRKATCTRPWCHRCHVVLLRMAWLRDSRDFSHPAIHHPLCNTCHGQLLCQL